MKKILIFLVMIVFGSVGVLAVNQGINVTIGEDIVVLITPTTVEFGAVVHGTDDTSAISGNIIFDPTGSNVNINVDVTTVSGEPFHSGLEFDQILAEGEDYDILCVIVGGICTYTPKVVTPTLNVPIGSPAGLQTGVITYTITGTIPSP